MKIGELSRRTGVSVRALRHYEDEGLLRPDRRSNGYRDFAEDAVDAVLQIRALIDSGLPVRIIREVLPYLDGPSETMPTRPCAYLLKEVARQADLLERRIHSLTRNHDALVAYLRAGLTLTQP
ncbi:MerR family transcriptional regulator [Dactylosporangium sp. NPDC050588]|uniref:MerR family transcriptional regulator n=1 Tax=Dactylosporangium sp. NPDC050588 TaxID=3157211 RepID=UPI0033FA6E09